MLKLIYNKKKKVLDTSYKQRNCWFSRHFYSMVNIGKTKSIALNIIYFLLTSNSLYIFTCEYFNTIPTVICDGDQIP